MHLKVKDTAAEPKGVKKIWPGITLSLSLVGGVVLASVFLGSMVLVLIWPQLFPTPQERLKLRLDPDLLRRYLADTLPDYVPQWTPDGSHIVFMVPDVPNTFVVSTDGSKLVGITDGLNGRYAVNSFGPEVSPDGHRLVYATTRPSPLDGRRRPTVPFQIETSRLDGTDRRRLTADRDPNTRPFWSPSGREVVFKRGLSGDRIGIVADSDQNQERVIEVLDAGKEMLRGKPLWLSSGDVAILVQQSGGQANYALKIVSTDEGVVKTIFRHSLLQTVSDEQAAAGVVEIRDEPRWGS